MDASKAREFVEGGAFVFALDVPGGVSFGIDYDTWTLGPNFKGMKMIPPGCHYIHFTPNSSGINAEAKRTCEKEAERLGFFCWLSKGQVVVLRWDAFLEAPVLMSDSGERQKLAHAVRNYEYDQFLAPYPLEHLSKWDALTSNISSELILRLGVAGKWIAEARANSKQDENDDGREKSKQKGEEKEDTKALLFQHPHYCDVPARLPTSHVKELAREGKLSSALITKIHMDKSYVLDYVLQCTGYADGGNEGMLLGEFQFAFVSFYVGHSFDGFKHWKRLVVLFCGCDRVVEQQPVLFKQFVVMLTAQLKEVPSDFFVDPLAEDNFLQQCLLDLYESIAEASNSSFYTECARELAAIVKKQFDWDISDEVVRELMSSDAPTIVH